MQRIARPVGPFARHQATARTTTATASHSHIHVRTLCSSTSTHYDGHGHVHGVNEVCSCLWWWLWLWQKKEDLTPKFERTSLFSRFYVLGPRFETRKYTLHRLDLKPNHRFPPFPNPLQKRRPCLMFGPFHIP